MDLTSCNSIYECQLERCSTVDICQWTPWQEFSAVTILSLCLKQQHEASAARLSVFLLWQQLKWNPEGDRSQFERCWFGIGADREHSPIGGFISIRCSYAWHWPCASSLPSTLLTHGDLKAAHWLLHLQPAVIYHIKVQHNLGAVILWLYGSLNFLFIYFIMTF